MPTPAPTVTQATENLIRNPGFEAGLSEWDSTRDINPADSATFDVTDGRSISGAMSAVGVDTEPGNLGRLYQDVTNGMVAGRTYEIGGWIWTEGVEGQVVIGLDYVNSDGWTPGGESYVWELGHVTGTRDWTYVESDPFVLPPAPPRAGVTALWFLFDFNNGAGTAWWDDVFLREVSRPAPAAACLNGGSATSARLALATGQSAFAADRANLREDHSLLATRVGQIRGRTADRSEVRILDGPWFGADFVWWLVESQLAAVADAAGRIPDDGFARGRVTGWVAEVDQRSLWNLTPDLNDLGKPAISGQIAFVATDSEPCFRNADIFVLDTRDSGLQQLTTHPRCDGEPSWAPDGRALAYVSMRERWPNQAATSADIFVLDLANNTAQLVVFNAELPAWSPDGREIAFTKGLGFGATEIRVVDVGSGVARQLVSDAYAAAWSPDGSRVAYFEHGGGVRIGIVNSDGGGRIRLVQLEDAVPFPFALSWSPDGGRFAFSARRLPDELAEIFLVNADGSGLVNVTSHPAKDSFPAWSPDGRWIAFISDRSGGPPPATTTSVGECVPELLTPSEGAQLDNGRRDRQDTITWTFSWTRCAAADRYRLFVKNAQAPNPVIDDFSYAASYVDERPGSYIIESNRYGWSRRVQARTPGELGPVDEGVVRTRPVSRWGEWSPDRGFSVEPLNSDPGPPTLPQLAPATYYGIAEPGDLSAAFVNGVLCTSNETDSNGEWALVIPGAPFAPGCQPSEGDIVTFTPNGQGAAQQEVWRPGGVPADWVNGMRLTPAP